ncbi:MAG: phage major capsid protein [Dongiaceae bacterium]
MALNPGVSELITTTLRNRSGKLADNVSKNNALLGRLRAQNKVRTFGGGRSIMEELEYAENSTFRRYTGYEVLNIQPSDVFTAAEFDIKQAAVVVSMSGLEMLQNAGKEQIISLLEKRVDNAERTLMNNISLDIYSDGTADNGKQIGGLQLLVADSPATGTVGGINRASWSFWRNQVFDLSDNGLGAPTTSNIQTAMNRLYLACSRGNDSPDLIVADNNFFRLYWESLQAIQRVTSSDEANAGFNSLKYMNADVVFDGGIGGGAPANRMYFLNTKYIYFRPHKDRNFQPLEPDRFSMNQDAMVKLIAFAGNLTLSNASLQGVLLP